MKLVLSVSEVQDAVAAYLNTKNIVRLPLKSEQVRVEMKSESGSCGGDREDVFVGVTVDLGAAMEEPSE